MVKGKRAKKLNKVAHLSRWAVGDRTSVEFEDGETYSGSITELAVDTATIEFDDGEVLEIDKKRMEFEIDDDFGKPASKGSIEEPVGFSQYSVKWCDKKLNFKADMEDIHFHGSWRITGLVKDKARTGKGWAVDIWARHGEREYAVESLLYLENDPREDIKSLNQDICAAINKWFFHHVGGTVETIQQLRKKADQPMLYFNTVVSLELVISKLQEYLDTSLYSGGTRYLKIKGDPNKDGEENPEVLVAMDLTIQAIASKGSKRKERAVLDNAKDGGTRKGQRVHAPEAKPSKENVEVLQARLKTSKDPTEKRELRKQLRKMGHKGGMRGSTPKVEAPEKTENTKPVRRKPIGRKKGKRARK